MIMFVRVFLAMTQTPAVAAVSARFGVRTVAIVGTVLDGTAFAPRG